MERLNDGRGEMDTRVNITCQKMAFVASVKLNLTK